MSSKIKQWIALTVVGVLAVMAAGWFLLVSPKRTDAAQVRADVDSQNAQNVGLETQLAMLKAQAKTLPREQAKLARVAAKIPDNAALPALIRALSAAADDAGVELVSMAPGSPTPVTTTAAGTTGTPSATSKGTGSTETAAKPTTLASATSASSTFSPGVLTSIPLTINVVGGYFQIEQFFDKLENLTRATKVTGFNMAPGANPMKPPTTNAPAPLETGKVLTTSVTANVYMAVGRGSAPTSAAPVK